MTATIVYLTVVEAFLAGGCVATYLSTRSMSAPVIGGILIALAAVHLKFVVGSLP